MGIEKDQALSELFSANIERDKLAEAGSSLKMRDVESTAEFRAKILWSEQETTDLRRRAEKAEFQIASLRDDPQALEIITRERNKFFEQAQALQIEKDELEKKSFLIEV